MAPLVACAHCEQHILASEHQCPHCGGVVRDGQGRRLRTATAGLLGLMAIAGCDKLEPVDEYGPAPTLDSGKGKTSASASASASATASANASATASALPVPEYGPAPTLGSGKPDATGSAKPEKK